MNYTLQELAEVTNAEIIGDKNLIVRNIAYDSRIIYSTKNTAFLAINSPKNSGEKYIESAINKGIKIIISEKFYPEFSEVNWLIVENAVDFLQKLAAYHLHKFHLKTIGITGSNGKTIVKEWLYQCLWNEFSTVKSPKSFNSQIGLPLSLLKINEEHQLGIFEVGISRPGEMQKLEKVFQPEIGILTHIGNAHLANFNSEEQLIDEKIQLFKDSKIIIYNGDNQLVNNKINNLYSNKTLITYGFEKTNSIFIKSNLENKKEEVVFQYFDEEISIPIHSRDEATLTNVMALIAALKCLQLDNSKIIEKVNALKSVEMRLEAVEGQKNNLIINDSFNLDLDSLKTAFQFLNEYNKPKKSIVLTDFYEINTNSEALYSEIADLVNEQNFDNIFLIGEEIAKYKEEFKSSTYTFHNTQELLDNKTIYNLENQLILLKGSRIFEIEKIKDALELKKHDTILEVNLNAILHNINFHKSLLKPTTKMMAMVKANAYGLGSYEISEFLQHHHIDYLGVAFADEGVELRKKGITTPIIVMNPEQHSYHSVIEYNLEPEIYSLRVMEQFYEAVQKSGFENQYPIHIKLETGMHRLGFKDFEINDLVKSLKHKNLKVKSIFSHLSSADVSTEREFTLQQLQTFERISSDLISKLEYQPLRHILNSSGITNYTDYQYDMVRIGIGMLGESSNSEIQKQLQPSVTFKTVISQISLVQEGESISYSRNYKTDHLTKIATIPVGYADGIPRLVGNKAGFVGVNKQLVPIVGNVCMDMMMINIDDIPNVKEGDTVTIFNSKPSLKEFSEYCKTISYEVLTSISRRVKRVYIKD